MIADWFKRHRRQGSMVAVCPDEDGVAAALVVREDGRSPVLGWAEYLETGGETSAATVLEQLRKRRDLRGVACTSAVAIGEYNLLLVETPDVPPAELRAAIRWRVRDLIDFHVDDAVVDVFEVPSGRAGARKLMYAVVARAAAVKARIDALVAAGFELGVVDIPEFAIRNLAALLPEDVGGVAFISLARRAGLITLTRQSVLYLSRRVDCGTERLRAQSRGELTPEVEGLIDAIVIEIQRSLDYYESHFSQPPVQGVVIAPLGFEFPGLTAYLGRQLGIPTRHLDLHELIDTREIFAPAVQASCFAAVGAALRHEVRAL